MNRHTIFYSNYCEFSKTVISAIMQKNLKNEFILIDVNNPKVRGSLPPFVDRVPLICTKYKNVLIDDDIIRFIQMLPAATSSSAQSGSDRGSISSSTGVINVHDNKQVTGDPNIAPFLQNLPCEFALLEESGYSGQDGASCNQSNSFIFLNDMKEHQIQTPLMEDSKQKLDSAIFDQFIAQRKNDDDKLKPQRFI